MIAFLKTDALPRPQRVTAPPAKDDGKSGILTPTFEEGSLLLKDRDGAHFRVGWQKDDADRRRVLPPGEYTLTGYTLVRRDPQGKEWFVGASGKRIRKLTVRAGEEQKVALDEAVFMQCRPVLGKGQVQVQMILQGEHHSGLTLYRDGKRVLVGYRLTDGQGKEVASGQLEYG